MEYPLKDEKGKVVLKKDKTQPSASLRGAENAPLREDIQAYFECEILPFSPDALTDESKTKIGYEISFIRFFISIRHR